MTASWEKQESVLAYSLHVDNTTMAWAVAFRQLIIPGRYIALTGMPFDMGRNMASMKCLEGGFDYCFSLDSDVICPPDTILRLMKHKLPIVSGMYCRRSPPHGVPVMMKLSEQGGQWITQFPHNSLVEVDVCGAGCLLVHRSVLEKMKPQNPTTGAHWWEWRVGHPPQPGRPPLSEDYTFQVAAKQQLGVKTFVDTSIKCYHVGLAKASFGKFEPLDGFLQI